MAKKMRLFGFTLIAAAFVLLNVPSAKADDYSCTGTALNLEQSLSGGGSAVGNLCLTTSGSDYVATLYGLELNGSSVTGAKVFTIAWDGSAMPSSPFANDGNTWSAKKHEPANAGPWGLYDNVWTGSSISSDNYTGDGSLAWTFTSNPGSDFALHIGGFASTTCSVWISTQWSQDNPGTNSESCGSGTTTSAPEPSSVALLGAGLVGLALIAAAGALKRRRLSSVTPLQL